MQRIPFKHAVIAGGVGASAMLAIALSSGPVWEAFQWWAKAAYGISDWLVGPDRIDFLGQRLIVRGDGQLDFSGITTVEMIVANLIGLAPIGVIVAVLSYLQLRKPTSVADRFTQQRAGLANAKSTLADAVGFVEDLSSQLEVDMKRQIELAKTIDDLKTLEGETRESLEQKMRAIQLVDTQQRWIERVTAFVIGAASSALVAAMQQLL